MFFLDQIVVEEINPTLNKLMAERTMYLEYQKVQRELEHLSKLYIAYKFVTAQVSVEPGVCVCVEGDGIKYAHVLYIFSYKYQYYLLFPHILT